MTANTNDYAPIGGAGLILPVRVVNLNEARVLAQAGAYPSVITAGPTRGEVADFDHPDHHVVEFDDVYDIRSGGPTLDDVRSLVEWAVGRDRILVHCHAGISRSTATAWGICIAKGLDPEQSIAALRVAHPMVQTYAGTEQRSFSPNELIVAHLEVLLDQPLGSLIALAGTYARW
jgi:protein-tyrosine phosphatase